MKQKEFARWLIQFDRLTPSQKARLREVAEKDGAATSVPDALRAREAELERTRVCLHCGSKGVVRNGTRAGLLRFRCRSESCGRTFNALSGTNLKHMRHREKWELYEQCLRDRLSLHAAARRCGISYRTAFLWRHRFLANLRGPARLNGVVEMDETYFRESCKGERDLRDRRKPRRRGVGKRPSESDESDRLPVLTAVARGGATRAWLLPTAEAVAIRLSMRAWLNPECVLVTDAHPSYRAANRELGHHHESLNQRRGEWKRGSFHLNTVNNRHAAMKSICNRLHKGVSSRYFDHYASWLMCSEFRVDKERDPNLFQLPLDRRTPVNT